MKTPNVQANGIESLWVLAPFGLPVLAFYGLWFAAPLLRKTMMKSSPIVQNDVQLRIDQNGIVGMKHSIPWAKLQKAISTEMHLFLVDENNIAFIVPLRIFNSEFEAHEFVTKVQDFWAEGKVTSSPQVET